jgi:hypothetical protein
MSDIDQHDDSAEGGGLTPEGEGVRERGGMREDPAEGESDAVLREEQEGKGYGSRYGADEGEADPSLTEEQQ